MMFVMFHDDKNSTVLQSYRCCDSKLRNVNFYLSIFRSCQNITPPKPKEYWTAQIAIFLPNY